MKGIKRLLKLAILGIGVYLIVQRIKGDVNGYLPTGAVSPEEDTPVAATDSGYEVDESKLGGEVSQDLLDILVCPLDKGPLDLVDGQWLVNSRNGYKYPIVDGIPVMLIEVGEKYKDESLITTEAEAV